MVLAFYFRFHAIKWILFVFFIILKNIDLSYAYINVLSPFASVIKADVGTNLILPCNVTGKPRPRISWIKNGRLLTMNSTRGHLFMDRRALLFYPLIPSDTGNYTCLASNLYDLKELTTVRWHVDNDGGYPITNFTLLFKPSKANASESWHMPQPVHVSPAVRQFFVYQLKPDTNYTFKIWANNKLGPGEAVFIRAATCKPIDPPELFSKMLTDVENFGATAWLLAVCMVAVTILTLAVLSFALVFREQRNGNSEENVPRIITNPGFEIDVEQRYLLEHADFNDNIEKPVRLNNNTVIVPSRV
ncbi:uncharacterized protein CEXT_600671 [Caerostris extrusa]|uniref:Uncharacterized protein n=1 Tax=Caerostris extrusa TaxID=172846 RepID=A0AAV4W760_CAEEX|nr:uncharacterized protein CEXT_600671 [Caerostris extrusa]